jgi:hypothetical protein
MGSSAKGSSFSLTSFLQAKTLNSRNTGMILFIIADLFFIKLAVSIQNKYDIYQQKKGEFIKNSPFKPAIKFTKRYYSQ